MADRPILFSSSMVRALLDGTKTQTRRVLNPQPINEAISIQKVATAKGTGAPVFNFYDAEGKPISAIPCKHCLLGEFIPHYAIGDRLWVRESWNVFGFSEDGECATPLAGIPTKQQFDEVKEEAIRGDWQIVHSESERAREWFADQKWRPSIHMPRWASRLTLIVTDVRVQRLKDISEEDAIAEGVARDSDGWRDYLMPSTQCGANARDSFRTLWTHINGPDAWCANPWVVAVSFTVEQRNIDA